MIKTEIPTFLPCMVALTTLVRDLTYTLVMMLRLKHTRQGGYRGGFVRSTFYAFATEVKCIKKKAK